jgi:hypothetical protein
MAGPNANLSSGEELVALPLNGDVPFYSFTMGLSGTQFYLTIRYNSRMDRWIMDVADATQSPVIVGVPLLIGVNLLGRFSGQAGLPVGALYVTDNIAGVNQPTRNSFGLTHTLWYLDPLAVT